MNLITLAEDGIGAWTSVGYGRLKRLENESSST
jgi:hypothetical protein